MHLEFEFGRSGYTIVVRLIDINSPFVQVGVLFLAVERTCVVQIGGQQQVVMVALPGMAHTCRESHATVVIQRITRVGFRVQIIGTQVQRGTIGPLKGFSQIEQFRPHIRFQSCLKVVPTTPTLNLHSRLVAALSQAPLTCCMLALVDIRAPSTRKLVPNDEVA